MATINARTFPGVYAQVIDRSYLPPQTSRFSAGLIGVARKGPFNTPTAVRSLSEFIQTFGQPLDGDFFLANAVAILSDLTDGVKILRVGNSYTTVSNVQASGTSGGTTLTSATNRGQIFSPAAAPYGQGKDVFVRITQPQRPTTVAQVVSASPGTITVDTDLKATYAGANIAFSNYENAATPAEGVLYGYTYGDTAGVQSDVAVTAAGTVTGNKGDFTFSISGNAASLTVGDTLKIKQTGKVTTNEVKVLSVWPDKTVFLENSDNAQTGFQAVPLQDSYGAASAIYKATNSIPFLFLKARTAGDWANGETTNAGLYVKVKPGSAAGTKKLEVYENDALVETIDNLSADPTSTNWYVTRIGTETTPVSSYIYVDTYYNPTGVTMHAANTVNGWGTNTAPFGRINAGGAVEITDDNAQGDWDTGGGFHGGQNGENAQAADYIGVYDATSDTLTGIKAFENTAEVRVDFLAAPGFTDQWGTSMSVHQELARVAKKVNAVALIDVPAHLDARQAVDWQNGVGVFSAQGRGRINSANAAIYWNWFDISDPFTQETKTVPPTLAALRCLAFTFDRDKPWYAAAGDIRGLVPEALAVEYPRVSEAAKDAMYGNGQSVNPLLLDRGAIKLFGERTQQVAESKLSVVHSVVLVNYIVYNLSNLCRRFVFEPNDPELLVRIRLACSQFLDKVQSERGVEQYLLIVDDTNNTATTRNAREVIIDLAVIPTDTAERILINATVRESGAELNSVATI